MRLILVSEFRRALDPEARDGYLLIHMRTEFLLESKQVHSSFHRFLGLQDPELANITPMSLLSSYAHYDS